MDIILLGAPGAGKGTQAKYLEEHTGMVHVASGDLFRAALRQGTELGMLAKSYMDRGELVPDEVVIRMIVERISQPDCSRGVIFDGFPRTREQARALEAELNNRDGGSMSSFTFACRKICCCGVSPGDRLAKPVARRIIFTISHQNIRMSVMIAVGNCISAVMIQWKRRVIGSKSILPKRCRSSSTIATRGCWSRSMGAVRFRR